MNRISAARIGAVLAIGITFLITACNNGSSSSSSALNLAGTWTITTVSTQGHPNYSGTATLTQSGPGPGANGTTTLAAPVGQIAVTQNGTALTGTVTTSASPIGFNYTGTFSNGSFTVTGSTTCYPKIPQSTTITGTATSTGIQGTYTITRGSGCYYPSDAGTFTATKK